MKKIFSLILLFVGISAFAQDFKDSYVAWQPDVKLSYDMFQGQSSDATVGVKLLYAMDVPASNKAWKKGAMEKAYFCAVMDKDHSYLASQDEMTIKYNQMLFDICELAARTARKELADMQTKVDGIYGEHANGAVSAYFMTAVNDAKELGIGLTHAVLSNVILPNDIERYKKYRIKLDDMLFVLQDYATTEQDVQRFVSGTPEKGYKSAPSLGTDSKNRGELEY